MVPQRSAYIIEHLGRYNRTWPPTTSKEQQVNEAQGQAAAILAVATATAEGLRRVGEASSERGGIEAMQLRIGEEYVRQFGKLAKESTTLIVPGQLSELASVVSMATSLIRRPGAQRRTIRMGCSPA